MHLAMDAGGDVLALEITDTETGDSSGLDRLLPQVGEIDRLIADPAYDQIEMRRTWNRFGAYSGIGSTASEKHGPPTHAR
jgi:hypothetical protein